MQSYFSCGDIGLVSSIGKVRSAERFLDYFEGTVDRFRGTGKPNFVLSWSVLRQIFSVPKLVIMLNNFLIADRAMPWRQLITRPTMVDNNSATLIYNIFTNKCSEYYASGQYFWHDRSFFPMLNFSIIHWKNPTRESYSSRLLEILKAEVFAAQSFTTTQKISSFWEWCR